MVAASWRLIVKPRSKAMEFLLSLRMIAYVGIDGQRFDLPTLNTSNIAHSPPIRKLTPTAAADIADDPQVTSHDLA